jgi:hypothetical protein
VVVGVDRLGWTASGLTDHGFNGASEEVAGKGLQLWSGLESDLEVSTGGGIRGGRRGGREGTWHLASSGLCIILLMNMQIWALAFLYMFQLVHPH